MHEICRKDHLARNLARLSRLFPKDYNFFPKTWILPLEWADLKMFLKSKRHQTLIAKPDHGCQGKGIFLFRSLKAIQPMKQNNIIVQTYLNRPYLIDHFKFDLRVYVLVLSAEPLRVFIHRDGLVRFATHKYSEPSESNLGDVCMHLTNYAINKKSETFDHSEAEDRGSKRTIKSVFKMLEDRGVIKVEALWAKISDVVVKTLLTIQPQLSMILKACFPSKPFIPTEMASDEEGNRRPFPNKSGFANGGMKSQCFEILGFDIFLDNKLKPWVLEVNHSPSFTCDSPLDTEVKQAVIQDAFGLLNLSASTRKKFEKAEKEKVRQRLLGNLHGLKDSKESTLLGRTAQTADPKAQTPSPVNDMKEDEYDSDGSDQNDDEPPPYNLPTPSTPYYPSERSSTRKKSDTLIDSKEDQTFNYSQSTLRISTSSSAQSVDPSVKELSQSAQELIRQYYALYPPGYLEALKAYEDAHLGSYFRVFPPENQNRLAKYIKFLNGASKLFSDTVSTKGRQEHIRKKKELEELQAKKLEQWKQKIKETNSNEHVKSRLMSWREKTLPEKHTAERRHNTATPMKPQPLQMGSSSLSIQDIFLQDSISDPNLAHFSGNEMRNRFFRNRGSHQRQGIDDDYVAKKLLKLHVESMNDRFMQSLTDPSRATIKSNVLQQHSQSVSSDDSLANFNNDMNRQNSDLSIADYEQQLAHNSTHLASRSQRYRPSDNQSPSSQGATQINGVLFGRQLSTSAGTPLAFNVNASAQAAKIIRRKQTWKTAVSIRAKPVFIGGDKDPNLKFLNSSSGSLT
jgi:hypothetical protein